MNRASKAILIAAVCVSANSAFADWTKWYPQAEAGFLTRQPSAKGLSLAAAAMNQIFPDHWIYVGPRAGVLSVSRTGGADTEAFFGGEASVWVMNAIGPGLAIDWLTENHARISPLLSLRLKQVGQSGAIAFRAGVPYDFKYKWGIFLGFTLQLRGATELH